jgi:hypothetical protein
MTAPDTTYADPAQLAEWMRSAAPGHQAIYARGCGLNPENATVQLVASWRDAREVVTVQKRIEGVLSYLVQRCGAVPVAAGGGRSPKGGQRWPENPAERVLLDYIEGLAADGLPLPVNSAIAEVLGRDCRDLRDKDQVRYRLRQLQAGGWLRIVDVEGAELSAGAQRARRATICRSGAMTAGLVGAGAGRVDGRANGRERAA